MHRAKILLLTAALMPTLSACGSGAQYPSLATRPAERISGSAEAVAPEPEPPTPPLPASGELSGRLAQLVEQARGAHQRFTARRGAAERTVAAAAGAAVASESWSVASVALADLQSARSQTMIPLAEIDRLYAAETVAMAESGNPANAEAAAAARAEVDGWVAAEDAILLRLRGRLRD